MIGLDNPLHLMFLLMLLLLVFGAKRLPELGRSLGAGMRGFKDSLSADEAPPANLVASETAGLAPASGERSSQPTTIS